MHPSRQNQCQKFGSWNSQPDAGDSKKIRKGHKQITRKKSVLENEIIAETFPFDNAVKIPDEMMLIPLNKKFTAKMRNPTDASSKVAESLVKTDTINPEHRTDNTTMNTEQMQVNFIMILYVFRRCSFCPAPYWKPITGLTPIESPMKKALNKNCPYKRIVIAATPDAPASLISMILNRKVTMELDSWLTISEEPL